MEIPICCVGCKNASNNKCVKDHRTAGKTLHIVEETEPRIFINMHGSGYIQIFDEDYPGFVDGFYVNYCPMCGARLRSGYIGGEPPKEG